MHKYSVLSGALSASFALLLSGALSAQTDSTPTAPSTSSTPSSETSAPSQTSTPSQATAPSQSAPSTQTTAPAQSSGDDVMAGYYGNTTVSTGGMAETHTVYNADHTFVMKVPAFGLEFKGTWTVSGATLCRTFESPPPGVTNPLCTSIEAHKVGDTWTVTTGSDTRTVTLVQGVQ